MDDKDIKKEQQLTLDFNAEMSASQTVESSLKQNNIIHLFKQTESRGSTEKSSALKRILKEAEKITW